jgi:hypothetical protein
VTASWVLHSIAQATGGSLISLCKELLQQHASKPQQQQRKQGQQGLPRIMVMDCDPQLLCPLHVKLAWDMFGTCTDNLQRLAIREVTLEQATRWEVPERLRQ